QALIRDGTRQMKAGLRVKSRREIPFVGLGIPGNRSLEQKTADRKDKAAADRSGADVIFDPPLTADGGIEIAHESEEVPVTFLKQAISQPGLRLKKSRRGEPLGEDSVCRAGAE